MDFDPQAKAGQGLLWAKMPLSKSKPTQSSGVTC